MAKAAASRHRVAIAGRMWRRQAAEEIIMNSKTYIIERRHDGSRLAKEETDGGAGFLRPGGAAAYNSSARQAKEIIWHFQQ